MCMQNSITIFHSVQEIRPFSHFQNLELGKASTEDKCYFATPWARSCQYQCVCKSLSNYSKQFKNYGHFSQTVRGQNLRKLSVTGHCRIWTSAKPRPMTNGIWQSLGLDLVNINFITIFHSVQEIGPFSRFQNLELGKILLISMCMQKFIKIFQTV